MILIDLSEEELRFFDEIEKCFPENMIVKKNRGFDGSSSVQVVIDVASILKECLPYIVGVVEAILVYRISKQQIKIQEKQVKLEEDKNALEKEKANSISFEMRSSSNGECQYLIKSDDADNVLANPGKLRQLIDELKRKLEVMEEKPKKAKKAK